MALHIGRSLHFRLTPSFIPMVLHSRGATKKVAGSVDRQHHNRKRKGKRLGIKVEEGEYVQPGAVLVRQKGFKFHPGRNVDFGRDYTLYALREGHIKITEELIDRPADQAWGQGLFHERVFVHIIEQEQIRRLVCVNPDSIKNVILQNAS